MEDNSDYYSINQDQQKASPFVTKNNASKEKTNVAIISIAASTCLAILKLVVGLSTNSLGILSESLHSGLDIIAAIMTLYAIRMMIRPPDLSYTYGYAKVESIASLS